MHPTPRSPCGYIIHPSRLSSPLTFSRHTHFINSAAFNPDGRRIVTSSFDKITKVWNASSRQLLRTLEGYTDGVFFAAFSPDGTRVVTSRGDNITKVWDASSLQAGSVSPPALEFPLNMLSILSPARNSAVSDSSVTLHLQVDNPQSLALRFAASVSKNSTRIQGLTVTSSSRDLNLTVPIPSSLNLQDGERFTVTLEGFTPSGDKLAVKNLELTYQKATAPVSPVLPPQKKLALVIGIKDYLSNPLKNPLNDARDMRVVLQNLGFEIMTGPGGSGTDNLDVESFKKMLGDFGARLRKQGGMGLFYFSGHGTVVQGDGYLLPIKNIFQDEVAIQLDAIKLEDVLKSMTRSSEGGKNLNVVIVDACRAGPVQLEIPPPPSPLLPKGGVPEVAVRVSERLVPSSTLVAFATRLGTLAQDGEGQNSPYTAALKTYLADPTLYASDIFYKVYEQVYNDTRGAQEPYTEGNVPSFHFGQ